MPSAGRATADPELERGQTCHPRGWPAGRGMSPWSSPASFHLLRRPVTAWRLRKRAGQKQGSRCPVCTVKEGRGGAPHLDGLQGARQLWKDQGLPWDKVTGAGGAPGCRMERVRVGARPPGLGAQGELEDPGGL